MKLSLSLILLMGFLTLACCQADDNELIFNKAAPILANLLTSEDAVKFAKANNIDLKDGVVKVVIELDKNFLSTDLATKYGLVNFKQRKNMITAYVSVDNLRKLCNEPSVVFIRLPAKFNKMKNHLR